MKLKRILLSSVNLLRCFGISLSTLKDYCDIEWFALEMNRDHPVVFEIASKDCISGFIVDYEGYSISFAPWKKSYAQTVVKSLQSCPTLCDPRNGSPPGSPVPGILQARVLEWGAIAFSDPKL